MSGDEERENRYRRVTMSLATSPDTWQALIAHLPVPRSLLKGDLLEAIGERRYGPDFILSDEAAARLALVLDAVSLNGDQPKPGISVLRLDHFLEKEYPPPVPLLGDPDGILYIARSTFLLLYGDGGAGKSTLTIDAVAHMAAGEPWLGIPVPRPVRILLIENEGTPGLFQAKLAAKAADWDKPPDWTANVLIYAEPWSRFTFADPAMRVELGGLIGEWNVDLVVANPLFGVGGPGAGKPEETGAFVEWLKELGMWNDGPAFWLLHHQNKLGQVSGDWTRQPDTTIALEPDGDSPRSLLTWEKVRWIGDLPDNWRRKNLLNWDTAHKGYELADVDFGTATDSQLASRLDTYLEEHPWSSTTTITDTVQGNAQRLRDILKESVEMGRYQTETGSRGARLYALAQEPSFDPVLTLRTTEDGVEANPHGQYNPPRPTPRTTEGRESSNPEQESDSVLLSSSPVRGRGRTGSEDGVTQNEANDADADIPF